MTEKRRYRLLCPIARALDVIGDRWALLILRDLHAAPARFQQLEEGLGIATNLLSSRLKELSASGLIQKSNDAGRNAYELTDLGRRTDRILWELARFGSHVDPVPNPREPGNLRTIALPLRIMLESVENRPELVVRLLIDNDAFTITSSRSGVDVEYGDTATSPQLVVRTDYQGFLELGEGLMTLEDFTASHLRLIDGAEHSDAFLNLMSAAMTHTD
jgi:DNA-binding HxlR family transcriptional regulator